ncbi:MULTISPECIES: TrmB family transcriptional regulator [Ferroplasma]|jgi:sugar-specific transcriptional regulator TrmB|uniref:Transcriptional regulator n=1 Tax=Ferroplasma acidarmanus Fer1 TaxID=333146 RepID=S0AMY6_FERAC|nr:MULTISPECIES: TrmB family transcriptional regulator [Ferroplasma]AGO60117.1 transcriptional regulator [Ferroplasma acidarmanus Fer1]
MDADLFDELKRFGLSNYEIKIYKTLLLKGPNTATGTVKIAGVPQPRIYDLFSSLEGKGFVDTVTGKRHLYRAVPVSQVLRREIIWLDNYVNEFESYVEKHRETEDLKEPYIWFVKGNKNVTERIISMIYSAKNEIIMALSHDSFVNVRKFINSALKKGITVALVLFDDTNDNELKTVPPGVILKKRLEKPMEMVLVDRNFILSNLKSGIENMDYSIYLEEDQLLHVLSYYFFYDIWLPSKYIIYPENFIHYKLNNIWLTCDIIDYYLTNNIKLKADLNGIINNKNISLKCEIIKTERINGVRQTFFVKDDKNTYSVGGKSALREDIKLIDVTISRLST